jgi:DNA polymerase-3 subunit delta
MEIKATQLSKQLQKGLHPFYTVVANEPFLAYESLDLLHQTAHSAGYTLKIILTQESNTSWSELLLHYHNDSLFDPKQRIEFRIPTGKPGTQGAKILTELIRSPNPNCLLIIHLPALDYTTEKTQWFQMLKKESHVIRPSKLNRLELSQWIQAHLSAQNQTLDSDVLTFLTDQFEGNLLAAHQEIQKLSLLYPAGPILLEQAKNAVWNVSHFEPADLTQALLEYNLMRFQSILRGLISEGIELPLLLGILAHKLRQLHQFLRPDPTLGRNSWLPDQAWFKTHAHRFTPQQCERALLMAHQADRQIKGLASGSPERTLLKLAYDFIYHTPKTHHA